MLAHQRSAPLCENTFWHTSITTHHFRIENKIRTHTEETFEYLLCLRLSTDRQLVPITLYYSWFFFRERYAYVSCFRFFRISKRHLLFLWFLFKLSNIKFPISNWYDLWNLFILKKIPVAYFWKSKKSRTSYKDNWQILINLVSIHLLSIGAMMVNCFIEFFWSFPSLCVFLHVFSRIEWLLYQFIVIFVTGEDYLVRRRDDFLFRWIRNFFSNKFVWSVHCVLCCIWEKGIY